MSGIYDIARENFREAGKRISTETDPVMFHLLFGLQSLTNQIEADFASLHLAVSGLQGSTPKKRQPQKKQARKALNNRTRAKAARRSR
jgi:hypothetical protein